MRMIHQKLIISWIFFFLVGAFFMYIFTLGRIAGLKETIQHHVNLETKAEQTYHFDFSNIVLDEETK